MKRFKQMLSIAALTTAVSITPHALARYEDGASEPGTPAAPATPGEVVTGQTITVTSDDASDSKDVVIVRPDRETVYFNRGLATAFAGEARAAKMVKAAYLGIGVSSPQEILTEQLKLPRGVGLVVEYVEKDSPAEKAGLQARDILHKLDEQLLINPQQLATLVRTFKPNDAVKLTVIRKGEPTTLNATLIEKELPELSFSMNQSFEFSTAPLAATSVPGFPMHVQVEGHKLADVGGHGEVTVHGFAPSAPPTPRLDARVIRVMPGSTSKIIKVDNGQRIELEIKDGVKSLRIVENDGKVTFEGPYTTPEEQEKLPAELREKVKSVEQGIELKEVPATSPSQPKADADLTVSEEPAA